jgi:DNA-binding PadR family transcriptional regulator
MKEVEREILLSFWKVHILHHAEKQPIIGQWVIRELRRHGYDVSPGTLYPLLARMRDHGWLRCKTDPDSALRARKEYSLTKRGREVLALPSEQVEELDREVALAKADEEEIR